MEQVATNGFTYLVGAATIIGVIIAYLSYRYMTKPKPSRTLQTMTDSVDGIQTATRDDVQQDMKNTKGGKQNA